VAFKPGQKKAGGRKAGTPNKTTVQLKQAILDAFQQVGGARYLAEIAQDNPGAFCTLLGKVLPMDIQNTDGSLKPTIIRICGPDE
jgi:hypothetical protein